MPKSYYLLYSLLSIIIDDGLYARHAILNALKVEAGNPQHEKHFLSSYTMLFLALVAEVSSELF